MGSLSVSTPRGLVHWQGLLLLVSLLTFWNPPTTAEVSIVPVFTVEGKDVVLCIHNKPPEVVGIVWYKGNHVDKNNVIAFFIMTSSFYLSGPGNNGVEMITDDGSLLLKKVTMEDTGVYTVAVHLPDSKIEIGTGLLYVYERLRVPVLRSSHYWVTENEQVVLTCYTKARSIQWLFNGMNMHFTNRMQLNREGRRLTIDPVKREDAGVYKCIASNPAMRVESGTFELHVLYQ